MPACARVSACVCVRQPQACPRVNVSPVEARTPKFGQKVQNIFVKFSIDF